MKRLTNQKILLAASLLAADPILQHFGRRQKPVIREDKKELTDHDRECMARAEAKRKRKQKP